jgi:hypothetical protein
MAALKLFETDIRSDRRDHNPWPAIEIVAQEIFLAELVTRVWSAALLAFDREYDTNEFGGLAHSIHIAHLEAKNRAMRLLLDDPHVDANTFERLNSLRRKVERWTDLLLSQIPDPAAADSFAFSKNRVHDFRQENNLQTNDSRSIRQMLFTNAIAEDFGPLVHRCPANPDVNRLIAEGLLTCFPADRFDSTGLPKSVQILWLEKSSNDTVALFKDLECLEWETGPRSGHRT